MLHTHLLFPSPHSHASPFLFPSRTNALRSRTFPATSIRGDSSSLRFRSHGCRIRNSAENDVVSETEHSKLPVTRAGAGLHVGHPLGYTATDILARYKRMQGYNVLHPMRWDAFGLPAEQYAIETGTHPKLNTVRNINRFRTQAEVPVNWCPALGTVLAIEEVIDGVSEWGGHPVIRKPVRQWMLKIIAYADCLLEDLDDLDWPESVKEMQRNWIGRSEGAEMEFCILDSDLPSHGTRASLVVIIGFHCPEQTYDKSVESGKAFSGIIVNSSNTLAGLDINSLSSKEAALKVIEWAGKSGNGKRKVNYKLRDWLFARQRYWGEPIPVIFMDDNGETVPLCDTELPLTLPELNDFCPSGTGEPPLSKAVSWVKATDSLSGRPATRETNTMPQWAGSCWYYLRFMDPHNSKELVDKTKERYSRDSKKTWRLIVGSPLSDGTFKDRTVSVDEEPTIEQLRCHHKCIAKWDKHPRSVIEAFALLLSPYAPHMAEELWSWLGHTKSLAYEPFPKANPAYLKDSTVVLPVQINGKTRGTIQVEETCTEEDAFVLASRDEKLSKYLHGQSVKKRIYVPGKILNIVLGRKNVKVGVQ
ncbi:hypothetical protein JHK87_045928 [Glycine soja]|nr:hypothetical protein JHK87_045928 [Glycine soja]